MGVAGYGGLRAKVGKSFLLLFSFRKDKIFGLLFRGANKLIWRLEVHAQLPSTADLCRERAEAGEAEGLAILALRQSAGRGTRGREWADGAGNLALSLLLRPAGMADLGGWGLLAGVAVAEALEGFCRGTRLGLKWPNDVLLGGRKLAGILTEGATTPRGETWLTCGIGANLAQAPVVAGREVACLAEFGPPPAPRAVAEAVLQTFARWRKTFESEGFAPVREGFLARAPASGTAMTLRHGAGTVEGRFAGLDERGALLLQTDDGLRGFVAGEVTSATA